MVSSKIGTPTVTDCLRVTPRAQRGQDRALVLREDSSAPACACARSPTSLEQAPTADCSSTPSKRTSIRSARGPGVTSMTSVRTDSSPSTFDLERRLIRGLQGELAPNDPFGLFDQEALEHRLRPRGLDFLERAVGKRHARSRECVSPARRRLV